MHSSLIVLTILFAVAWRWQWRCPQGRSTPMSWQARWESALSTFCLPPLLLLLTAGAVLFMGHHGTMMGWSVSPTGCWASLGCLTFFMGVLVYSLGQAAATGLRLRQYPTITLAQGRQARCLPIDLPCAAQVGLWRSSLLVSQGWLEQLTASEQQAMLAHEQAHADCHDPFWFFWLGTVRRFAIWLPGTHMLWEELLLLREIRADRRAAQTSDPLLLAELLVKVSQQMALAMQSANLSADFTPSTGFYEPLLLSRLEQRVNALIEPVSTFEAPASPLGRLVLGRLAWVAAATLPLATIWLHT
ncbi:M56 family metallopeptidase [Nodosilinea nodulosa]|uniref:M56 family metallopeptidase n=1 Tax=Nodosilinea nodulosa TaxID=416001 RepID=UPI0002E9886C|nr:M56 family metallopeptidase [Nodosilinea nodulosa]